MHVIVSLTVIPGCTVEQITLCPINVYNCHLSIRNNINNKDLLCESEMTVLMLLKTILNYWFGFFFFNIFKNKMNTFEMSLMLMMCFCK